MTIDVSLFGSPCVTLDGQQVTLPVRKTLALFAYLVVEGHGSRAKLADIFWQPLDEATARRNLRRALHRLRASGLGAALKSDEHTVAVAAVRSDVADFRRAFQASRWGDAQAQVTGVFCDGLQIDDAPDFDAWLQTQREQFRRAWSCAAVQQAQVLEAEGQLHAAIALHERVLQADNLLESSYRHLMRLHDALGDRAAALVVLQRCECALRDELGLDPLPETRVLAEQIRARTGHDAAPVAVAATPPTAPDVSLDFRLLPLVARDVELSAVIADDRPMCLIEGDAGVGKTRLALEACRRLSGDKTEILVVRFTELSSATPFHGVADALRAPAVLSRLAGLDRRWRDEIARLLPELRTGRGQAKSDESTPAEARSRLLEALAQALAWVTSGTAALLFDDLHQADASSLELLVHLTRRRAQEPTLFPRVVATARAHELSGNASAVNALEDVERHSGLTRSTLGGFDESAMLRLVQTLSGKRGGVRFAARLGAATGGNVFFALETLRALFEAGEVRVDPAEGWYTRYDETTTDYAELPLPASVVDAVRARVARLGPAARRVLETAAVADDGSTLDEFKGATALSDWEALEGIERAVDAHMLNRAGAGYRFVHDLFRTAIRSGMSSERQRLTHAKLAAALEPLKVVAARVAAHWQAAGETQAAAAAWVRAAEEAAAVHAQVEASGHYERAALLTAEEEAAFVLHDRGFDHLMLSALDRERRAMLARLLARGQQSSSPLVRYGVLISAAGSANFDRDYARAERYILQALQDLEPPNAMMHVQALSVAGSAAGMLDRHADALAYFRQGYELAIEHGFDAFRVVMPGAACRFAVHLDRMAEAAALHEEALDNCSGEANSVAMCIALNNSSPFLRALGRRDEAVAQLQRAVSIGQSTQAHSYVRPALVNLCEALVDDGRLAQARAAHQELKSVFPDATEPLARYSASRTSAAVLELEGNLGGAIVAARAAVAASEGLGALNFRRDICFLTGRLTALTGAIDQARHWVVQAETQIHPGWSGTLLAAVSFHASLLIESDPAAARERLMAAMIQPFADGAMHLHLEAARILLARCELALGHPEAARETVALVHHSVALESQAIAVQIEAARHDGHGLQAAIDAGMALIDRACLPPAHALALMRVLSGEGSNAAARRQPLVKLLRPRMQAVAQSLADSLLGEPALQSAWIRQHRDLLT